ncbi:hypothetical protein P0136_05310 [Lentisphaerota bacterium ZTH]|nr:hypothetical protein JYG24_03575 [Lentisphaerota bacterium]WET07409.1 hypothetical protein P0136_05310 [Lentisphaerota bacterium ZTH]
MKNFIQECINSLVMYSEIEKKAGFFTRRHHKQRAVAVARCLADALRQNDLPRCRMIIAEQLRLLNPELVTGLETVRGTFCRGESANMATQHLDNINLSGKFYKIIRDTFNKIRGIKGYEYLNAGSPFIHRIWLGKFPGIEAIEKICLCDAHLDKIWKHPRTSGSIKKISFLWTNNQKLLNFGKFRNLIIKDYRLLTGSSPEFSQYVDSFLIHREYAFASDILRFLALYEFGGCFLGMPWQPQLNIDWHYNNSVFKPTDTTMKFFNFDFGGYTVKADFPFTVNDDLNLENRKCQMRVLACIDSDICYTGMPHSPLLQCIKNILLRIIQGSHGMNVMASYRKKLHEYAVLFKSEIAQRDSSFNVGGTVTNYYPLLTGLIKMGYAELFPGLMKNCHGHTVLGPDGFDLKPEYKWCVTDYRIPRTKWLAYPGYKLDEMLLSRLQNESWLKVPRGYQPGVEI